MITKWGVKNFKSILEADLELAPLTVFTGVNSSGKSSFLQSIIMLAQATRSKVGKCIPLNGALIKLDSFDRIYHKSSAEDKKQNKEIGINCSIHLNDNENVRLELLLSEKEKENLSIEQLLLEREKDKENEENKDYSIKCGDLNNEEMKAFLREIAVSYSEIKTSYENGYLSLQNNKIVFDIKDVYFQNFSFLPGQILYDPKFSGGDEWEFSEFIKLLADIPSEKLTKKIDAEKYFENIFRNHIPYDYYKKDMNDLFLCCANNKWWKDYSSESYRSTVLFDKIPYFKELFKDKKEEHFSEIEDSGSEYYKIDFSDWYLVLSNVDKDKQKEIIKELKTGFLQSLKDNIDIFQEEGSKIFLPEKLIKSRDQLNDYFKLKIKNLDPLRVYPKDELNDAGEPKKLENEDIDTFKKRKAEYHQMMMDIGVGVNGENTMPLIRHLNDIRYDIENYFSPKYFENSDYKLTKKKNFSDGLIEWLKYFVGMADNFKKGDDNTVNLVINELEFALTQLGTGVSQVLPVLVKCLIAPVDSTSIIQEPEQNLHPKWQSLLADVFIAMSLSGRQCLIETHSEYLIYMIRYRISQSLLRNDESIQKAIKLLYAEKENGETKFHEIKVNKHGEISAWPDGFFDERQKMSDKMLEGIISDMDI
jgi:predicted ATPase